MDRETDYSRCLSSDRWPVPLWPVHSSVFTRVGGAGRDGWPDHRNQYVQYNKKTDRGVRGMREPGRARDFVLCAGYLEPAGFKTPPAVIRRVAFIPNS